MVTTSPRIYVADLAAYNAGELHGRWIDAAQDADDLHAEVLAMLKPGHEEWAIHDFEGFGEIKLHEYEDLATVAALAAALDEHGEAFGAFYSNDPSGDVGELVERFEEAYAGEWDSEEAFAVDLFDQLGYGADLPDHMEAYFDWEKWTRDLFMGDYWSERSEAGTTLVFRSY